LHLLLQLLLIVTYNVLNDLLLATSKDCCCIARFIFHMAEKNNSEIWIYS